MSPSELVSAFMSQGSANLGNDCTYKNIQDTLTGEY